MKDTLHVWIDKLFSFAQLELLIVSVLIGMFAIALLRIQYQIRFERQRREESDRQLLNALQRITHLEDLPTLAVQSSPHFEQDLNHAELKNRLQAPASLGNAPGKYRHVASLADQGMAVEQIAEVLNISLPEANQLVSLARLAPRHN
ncbi:MAG: hypothetical protein B6I37_00280 [Desulfobacteraceae bacterium 4572_35.2]|nr:MAG: hypothetical protein B6I37_00280 [Desulfobacteraceae bacterium 4572_35.2]